MTDLKRASSILKKALSLKREPAAVKFLKNRIDFDGFRVSYESRPCQMLTLSRSGKKVFLSPFKSDCPALVWALDIAVGPEAAKVTVKSATGASMSIYSMIACCPLAEAPFEPDIVLIDTTPEQLEWIAVAKDTDIRFPIAKVSSKRCMGCELITDLAASDTMLGVPIKDLDAIVASLEKYGKSVKSVDKRLSN